MAQKNISSNSFSKGLWKDALPSLQPGDTYTDAWNAVNRTDSYDNSGLSSERGNSVFIPVPEGADIRGAVYAEERNTFYVFLLYKDSALSEIAAFNEDTQQYTKVINDNDLPEGESMCFSQKEWIQVTLKTVEPCSKLHLYWSNNYWYRRLNLDDDICDLELKDLDLLKCEGGPNIRTVRQETGGGVRNGIYQFQAQLEDNDGNTTNWFYITDPVSIADGNFEPGEITNQSIQIVLENMSPEYDQVNVAVISTIGGEINSEIVFRRNYGPGKTYIEYRGQSGDPISIQELRTKNQGYIRGRSLMQKNNRLVLYNTLGEINLDYQKKANDIRVEYIVMLVPLEEAHLVKTLRREERYMPHIRWNYCDGTHSADFQIPGRDATEYDRELIPSSDYHNCTNCDQQRWQVQNTAKRTWSNEGIIEEYRASNETLQAITFKPQEYKVHEIEDPIPQEMEELLKKDIDEYIDDFCNCESESSVDPQECPCVDTSGELDPSCCENIKETLRLFIKGNLQKIDVDGVTPADPDNNIPKQGNPEPLAISICTSCGSTCGSSGSGSCSGSSCSGGTCQVIEYTPAENLYELFQRFNITFVEERKKSTYSHGYGIGSSSSSGEEEEEVLASQVASSTSTGVTAKYAKVAIYDENECRIIDKQYPIVARGQTAYFESTEKYPDTLDCEGDDFLYGNLAGRSVRLIRMPSHAIEPHFVSYQSGVVNYKDRGNEEWQDTYVRVLGLSFQNIQPPENLPKPLDPQNPFTITYVERTPENKSVIASGLLTHTFKGEVYGKEYAFPKHGVNSLEYFDRNIVKEGDDDEFHGGEQIDANAYNFHSPDTCFNKPFLNIDKAKIDFELFGKGFRHGLYEEGDEPDSIFQAQIDQRGTRQSINLNHYKEPVGTTRFVGTEEICCDEPSFRFSVNTCEEVIDENPTGSFFVGTSYNITDLQGQTIQNVKVFGQGLVGIGPGGTVFEIEYENANENGIDQTIFDPALYQDIGSSDELLISWTIRVTTTDGCTYEIRALESRTQLGRDNCTQVLSGVLESQNCQEIDIVEEGPGINTRCVTGATYAPADSVVDAPEGISYPLMNIWRESSVYLELEKIPELDLDGQLFISQENSAQPHTGSPNGDPDGDLQSIHTNTTDVSFLGDVLDHQCPIHKAAGHYSTLLRHLPDQYGSPENQACIPMGLNGTYEDFLCKGIEGFCGDSFIGFYAMKRTGYVSNKVGNDLTPYFPGSNRGLRIFGFEILNGLLVDLGFGDCSKLPETGIQDDPRNRAGLRTGNCWSGTGSLNPIDTVDRDAYFPRVVKTNLMFIVESDVNLPYRQRGETDFGKRSEEYNFSTEVVYPELEDLGYDSSIDSGLHYDDQYLNRFAERHERIPRWKIIVRVLLHLAGIIIPPILFLTGNGINLSSLPDVGTLLLRLTTFGLLYAGILRITRLDNLDRLLGITQCRTDDEGGADQEHIYGFHDNYCRYNYDYSTPNRLQVGYSPDSSYNVCECLGEEIDRVIVSNPQIITSPIDSWRNYRINNYLDIDAQFGSIQDIFVMGDRAFIQTSDMILNLFSNNGQLELNDDVVFLGRGDFFNQSQPIYGGVVEGAVGTLDRNASVTTQWGRFMVDEKARTIYLFDGSSSPIPISDLGIRNFLKNNMSLKLMEQFPEFELRDKKSPYGVGFSFGIDHRNKRLLFTKVDYEAKDPDSLTLIDNGFMFSTEDGVVTNVQDKRFFYNRSFTLSYDPQEKRWVSLHSYNPYLYLWNRNDLYSFDPQGTAMWKHDSSDKFCNFYGEQHPFIVEFIDIKDGADTFENHTLTLDTEAFREIEGEKVLQSDITFDEYIGYNYQQNTGVLRINPDMPSSQSSAIENLREDSDVIVARYRRNRWELTGFVDRFQSAGKAAMFKENGNLPKQVNEDQFGQTIKNNKFFSNHHVNRLIFSKFDDIELFLKFAIALGEDKDV